MSDPVFSLCHLVAGLVSLAVGWCAMWVGIYIITLRWAWTGRMAHPLMGVLLAMCIAGVVVGVVTLTYMGMMLMLQG